MSEKASTTPIDPAVTPTDDVLVTDESAGQDADLVALIVPAKERELLIEKYADKVARNKMTVEVAAAQMHAELLARLDQINGDAANSDDTIQVMVREGDEYVEKTMSASAFAKVIEAQDAANEDPFALSPAYYKGDNGRFDYFYADNNPQQYKVAYDRGWVPVKQSLDGVHDDSTGVVRNGDLVLMKRPKDHRYIYERQDAARAAAFSGKGAAGMEEAADGSKYVKVIDDGMKTEEVSGNFGAPAKRMSAEEAYDRAQSASKGKQSFLFANNPIYDNKMRAARQALVGGKA